MKKLLRIKDIRYWILGISLFFVFSKSVHAQKAAEIPGPETKEASFIQVKDLNIGDVVFVKDDTENLKPEIISNLEYRQEKVDVYNLSVVGEETFFANDFAVHNKAGVDDVKPECRVIVNPTVTDVSSLVENHNFERPIWIRHPDDARENCPADWYNRSDGGFHNDQDWCDYGLAVTTAGSHPSGSQHVSAWYPNYGGFQRISGIEGFNSHGGGVLYRGSAWGKGGATYIGLRDGGRYGNIAPANNGDSWARGSLLGWDFDAFHLICRNCEEGWNADFDLVSLEKLVGSTNVSSQNVNLFVAYDDNRNVVRLVHWNQGEPEPVFSWETNDPRVIDFGPAYPMADGMPHALTGSAGSQTIYVKVMDGSGNESDPCSATVTYTPPTGKITGKVYQADETGACNTTNKVGGWTVTCDGIPAKKEADGVTFTCCKDVSCTDFQLAYDNYDIVLTAPAGWKMVDVCTETWSGSGPYTVSIPLSEPTKEIKPMYLWQGFQKWFQTQGGDVHAEGGITSLIPPSPSPDPYFSLRVGGSEKTAGVVTSGGSRDFAAGVDSTGIVSLDGWQGTEDSSLFVEKGKYNYDYYKDLLSGETSAIEEEFTDLGEETGNYTRGGGAGLIVEDGDSESVGTLTVSGGRKLIYLVDGDLQVKDNVEIEEGSFLAIIVSGDMTIDSGVTTLEGVYIADGTISTGTVGGDTVDAQLVLNGTFVGYGGFNLERDLKEDNTTFPAHVFTYRPEFIVNTPESLFTQPFTWKQVAPEGNP